MKRIISKALNTASGRKKLLSFSWWMIVIFALLATFSLIVPIPIGPAEPDDTGHVGPLEAVVRILCFIVGLVGSIYFMSFASDISEEDTTSSSERATSKI